MDKPEFPERLSKKHHFSVTERLEILKAWDTCLEPGEKSALCRRIGVTSNSVARWARDRRDGLLIATDERNNTYRINKAERLELVQLRRDNDRLTTRLAQSEGAVEVLGKASELLASLAKSSQLRPPSLPVQLSPTAPTPSTRPTSVPPAFGGAPSER